MSNKNYNSYYNQKPARTEVPKDVPAEEAKGLENVNVDNTEDVNVDNTENVNVDNTEDVNVDTTEDVNVDNTENVNVDEVNQPTDTKNVQVVRVVVSSLNIRKETDKESEIITVVKKDDELELRESTSVDGFYAVKTKTGISGYCMIDFVELK